VVLEQTRIGALAFVRKGDDWVTEILDGPDAVLGLPEIGVSIPMSELYADLALSETDGEAEAEA
jgi:hypothetical protein